MVGAATVAVVATAASGRCIRLFALAVASKPKFRSSLVAIVPSIALTASAARVVAAAAPVAATVAADARAAVVTVVVDALAAAPTGTAAGVTKPNV